MLVYAADSKSQRHGATAPNLSRGPRKWAPLKLGPASKTL